MIARKRKCLNYEFNIEKIQKAKYLESLFTEDEKMWHRNPNAYLTSERGIPKAKESNKRQRNSVRNKEKCLIDK